MREAASFFAGQTTHNSSGLLSSVLGALTQTYHSWQSRRQVVALQRLDDHLLADLGLEYSDVRWALTLPLSENPALELQRLAARRRRGLRNA